MTISPKKAFIRYAKACRKSGIGFSLGAVDFSYNEDGMTTKRNRPAPGRRVVHLWAFAKALEVEAARVMLRDSFPKTSKVTRPVKAYPYDGELQALAYAFKSDFSRRVQIPAKIGPDGKTLSRQNTRLRPLRAAQKVELAVLLNRLGLYDRLILRDIKLVKTSAGIRLKQRKP